MTTRREKEPPPQRNHRLLWIEPNNTKVTVSDLYELFNRRNDDPARQAYMAKTVISEKGLDPKLILPWISDEKVKQSLIYWCQVHGKLKDEPDKLTSDHLDSDQAQKLLTADRELIEALGPYIPQVQLARILQALEYRTADEETKHILVSGYYRLLGEYLGRRRIFNQHLPVQRFLPLPDLPPELYKDDGVRTLLQESEREARMATFNRSPEEGFRLLEQLKSSIDQPLQIQFIEELERYFTEVSRYKIPGLRPFIEGHQKDLPPELQTDLYPYPSFHQLEYAYRFTHKAIGPVDLLVGETRTRKSGGLIAAMKAAEARSTVLVCAPSNRSTWESEIREKYAEPVEIVIIDSIEDFYRLNAPESDVNRFVVLGYSLLSNLPKDTLIEDIRQFTQRFKLDSLGADEVHLANNPEANCTEALYILSKFLPENAPRIVMTATIVINTIEDLDSPMRFLLPYRYENPGDFTRAARNQPHLVAYLLHSQQVMTRWRREGILFSLPELNVEDVAIPLSPTHQTFYDFIYQDDTIEAKSKRTILRQVNLDPRIIIRHYRPANIVRAIGQHYSQLPQIQDDKDREIKLARINALRERLEMVENLCNLPQAVEQLNFALGQFAKWQENQDPNVEFNEDFLATLGFNKLILWAFFHYPKGVTDLVNLTNNPAIKIAWRQKEFLSSRYERLFRDLDRYQQSKDRKVAIFSAFYQDGVTSTKDDLDDITETEEDEIIDSLYDLLSARYGKNHVLRIDGTVSTTFKKGEISDRERIRRTYRLDPEYWILLTTGRSSRLGVDYTIPPTAANQHIKTHEQILLDITETHADMEQIEGRFMGDGQKIPNHFSIYRSTHGNFPYSPRFGFIDFGIWDAVDFKRLLSQMVVDTIPLTPAEEEKVKHHLSSIIIREYPALPQSYLTGVFFRQIRGRGYQANKEFLTRQSGFEGLTNTEFFIAYYPYQDELSLAGHNAKAVAQIIREYSKIKGQNRINRVASIGSGGGILQVMLDQPVVNVDMLKEILVVSRDRQPNQDGRFIQANAAYLPFSDSTFPISESSLVFNWTSNRPITLENGSVTTERVQALKEQNRVTQDLTIIALPHTHLNPKSFKRWLDTLGNYFGLRQTEIFPSGLLRATDYRQEPISWLFILEKVGRPREGFSLADLDLDFEPITTIIEPKAEGIGGSFQIDSHPPIPHQEFEIVSPDGRRNTKLIYSAPQVNLDELERSILRRGYTIPEVLADTLGIYEPGLFYRLRNHIQKTWDLSLAEAQEFAVKTFITWSESDGDQKNYRRMWEEMRELSHQVVMGE